MNGWCYADLRKDLPSLKEILISRDITEARRTHATWNSTLGPMQKKQSIIRKAKTIGMLLMNL